MLEAIWKTRNSVAFEGSEINVERFHQSLVRRYLEHLAVYGPNQIYKKPPRNAEWTRPEHSGQGRSIEQLMSTTTLPLERTIPI